MSTFDANPRTCVVNRRPMLFVAGAVVALATIATMVLPRLGVFSVHTNSPIQDWNGIIVFVLDERGSQELVLVETPSCVFDNTSIAKSTLRFTSVGEVSEYLASRAKRDATIMVAPTPSKTRKNAWLTPDELTAFSSTLRARGRQDLQVVFPDLE